MTDLASFFASGEWPRFERGWVWLAGAGPGDPGLLTLHGLNALRQADAIVYDALVDARLLGWARPDADRIFAGKRGGRPSPRQRDISDTLVTLARAGSRVLRLKGGDPFVFGRGGEEAQALVRAGIPLRVIPGVTAGVGGLAYAGIPVTHRDVNQSITFLTGHDAAGRAPSLDWDAVARGAQTVVIYMGVRHLGLIAERFLAAGRPADEPVAVIVRATTPEQRVLETTLARAAQDVDAEGIAPPALVVVGRSVLLRQALDWASGAAPRSLDPLGPGDGA